MTLILTMIASRGIVFLADSALTRDDGSADGTAQKLFGFTRLQGGVAVAGAFCVNGVSMADWLPARISEYEAQTAPTLPGFGEWIRRELEHNMCTEEKMAGCWLHIAGYVEESEGVRPALFVVSNVRALKENGDYVSPDMEFRPLTEEPFGPGETIVENLEFLTQGGTWTIANGLPEGRIAYLALLDELQDFFIDAWKYPGWNFRRPVNLEEGAIYLRMHFQLISGMFLLSSYPVPPIGGKITQLLIHRPPAPQRP